MSKLEPRDHVYLAGFQKLTRVQVELHRCLLHFDDGSVIQVQSVPRKGPGEASLSVTHEGREVGNADVTGSWRPEGGMADVVEAYRREMAERMRLQPGLVSPFGAELSDRGAVDVEAYQRAYAASLRPPIVADEVRAVPPSIDKPPGLKVEPPVVSPGPVPPPPNWYGQGLTLGEAMDLPDLERPHPFSAVPPDLECNCLPGYTCAKHELERVRRLEGLELPHPVSPAQPMVFKANGEWVPLRGLPPSKVVPPETVRGHCGRPGCARCEADHRLPKQKPHDDADGPA